MHPTSADETVLPGLVIRRSVWGVPAGSMGPRLLRRDKLRRLHTALGYKTQPPTRSASTTTPSQKRRSETAGALIIA